MDLATLWLQAQQTAPQPADPGNQWGGPLGLTLLAVIAIGAAVMAMRGSARRDRPTR